MQENIPTIAQHLSRGGATSVPGLSCGTQCADWWVAEHRPIPNQPSSSQLHGELRTFRSKATGVLPTLRVLGTIGLLHESFSLGWKIGSGIDTKFLRLGFNDSPPTGPVFASRLKFRAAGHQFAHSFYAQHPTLPYDGWVWEFQYAPNKTFRDDWSRSDGPGCGRYYEPGGRHAPPEPRLGGLDLLRTAHTNECFNGYSKPNDIMDSESAAQPEDTLLAPAPVEDYTDQPYERQTSSWQGQPQTQEELESLTRAALESGEYELLDDWYAHLLEPENYPDPTTTTQGDHRCDVSQPAYRNPDGNEVPPPHTPKIADPLPTTERPSGAADAPDPYLRWGETAWGGTHLDNWTMWGWRHIQAKHGWSAADEAATRQALAAPAYSFAQTPTSMRYWGPEYTQGGVVCWRRVFVEYAPDHTGQPQGVITSYGEFKRFAP